MHRLEKVLFATPHDNLQATLSGSLHEFSTPLLTLYPDDPAFMQQLQDFVSDPVVNQLYQLVDSVFGDMRRESEQLGDALVRMREAYPAMRYDKIYTYISGTLDYANRVACNSHECLVSIDQYVLPFTERYGYFGTPLYLVRQSHPKYMVADCIAAMARQYIAMPAENPTLLDYMVAEGKALYLASLCLPDTPDSVLLRYSGDQYRWMEKNEEHVWSFFLNNNLLFQNDYLVIHNYVDEAPSTNAFRTKDGTSAPRTTNYIGLRIVRLYMKKTSSTIQQLFDETNSQKILNASAYRPTRS